MTDRIMMLSLTAILLAAPTAAYSQSEMPPELIEAGKRPGGDAILRRAREEDHRQVVRLNLAQARDTAARDRNQVNARDSANARADARYRAELADWHRRVDVCQGGDWSQCDR